MMSMVWADEQGFTLVEILISTVMLSLLLIGVYGMYIYINDYYNTADYLLELQHQGYGALADITRGLKEAELVTLTDSVSPYDGLNDRIDATIMVDDSNGEDDIVEADFWADSGSLYRRLRWVNDAGTTTSDVTETLIDAANSDVYIVDSLELFDYDGAKLVTIRLRLRLGTLPEGTIALVRDDTSCEEDCIELYTDVYLRNKAT